MIHINIEVKGLDAALAILKVFPKILQAAKEQGLDSAGKTASLMTRQYIESGGRGQWPRIHPLSKSLRYEGSNRWGPPSSFGNLYGLGKFARYIRTQKNMITGFGTFPQSASLNAKFKPDFMRIAKTLQGSKIRVTDKMRRLMGATRWGKNAQAGNRFFPLRANTKVLHVPKRMLLFDISKILQEFVATLKKSFD